MSSGCYLQGISPINAVWLGPGVVELARGMKQLERKACLTFLSRRTNALFCLLCGCVKTHLTVCLLCELYIFWVSFWTALEACWKCEKCFQVNSAKSFYSTVIIIECSWHDIEVRWESVTTYTVACPIAASEYHTVTLIALNVRCPHWILWKWNAIELAIQTCWATQRK